MQYFHQRRASIVARFTDLPLHDYEVGMEDQFR
jgi:hypothetical protein